MTRRTALPTSMVFLTIFLLSAPPSAAQENSIPIDRAVFALLQSGSADQRVSYKGIEVTEIRSGRIDYAAHFAVNHDYLHPERDTRTFVTAFRDGEEITPEKAEVIEVPRPLARDEGAAVPPKPRSILVGGDYANLRPLRAFRIDDVAAFVENYEVRELARKTTLGRTCLVFQVAPNDAGLPSYDLYLDETTGLLIRSETSYPTHSPVVVSHFFAELTIGPESLPLKAAGPVTGPRLPDPDTFDLPPGEAAGLFPGLHVPRSLPGGFRIKALWRRPDGRGGLALAVEFSNGLARFVTVARAPWLAADDPLEEALARYARANGLAGLPEGVRRAALDAVRERFRRILASVRHQEEQARRERGRRAAVAWKRSRLGIRQIEVFTRRFDLLVVGPVPAETLLAAADACLNP